MVAEKGQAEPVSPLNSQMQLDGPLPDTANGTAAAGAASAPVSGQSIAQQMLQDGSLPDKAENSTPVPMRAVVAAAATTNPDAVAKTQQLAQRAGMPVDLAQANPQAAEQRATALDLERRNIEFTNPILSRQLQDPNFAAVAHDDLGNLSRIEQGAATVRELTASSASLEGLTPTQRQAVMAERMRVAQTGGIGAEAMSGMAATNRGFYGGMLDVADAGASVVQATAESVRALTTRYDWGNLGEQLHDIWTTPQDSLAERTTGAVAKTWQRNTLEGPQRFLVDPATQRTFQNPDYRWYGRPLVNTVEGIPGQLAQFLLTHKFAGWGGEAAGAGEAEASTMLPAVESGSAAAAEKSVPAILGTQSAQQTYAEARAKGADQKTAVLSALASGVANYAMMGEIPGAAPSSSLPELAGKWAGRSAVMGTGMAMGQNAIARSYDPSRSLYEGIPQSIATMAAFEGVGAFQSAMGQISDAVEASKLRKRSPQASQTAMDRFFEGDGSARVPSQDFVNYFAAKGDDPAAAAHQVGVSNLDEAIAAGSDLEIPKENFFGKLDPEHQKGLLPDLVDPASGMTGRQAEAGRQELQDWIDNGGAAKLQAEYEQADAETQATPEWQNV